MGTELGQLNVKVVPGSLRDQVVGRLGDALKLKVMAPPETGKANEAVVAIRAAKCGINTDDIEGRHETPPFPVDDPGTIPPPLHLDRNLPQGPVV